MSISTLCKTPQAGLNWVVVSKPEKSVFVDTVAVPVKVSIKVLAPLWQTACQSHLPQMLLIILRVFSMFKNLLY